MPDRPLTVLIECARIPNRAAVRQWTKASVEVIKSIFNQLDRDNETAQPLADDLVRPYIRAGSIAAKQDVSTEQRIPLPLKQKSLRQTHGFVMMIGEPFFEMLFLTSPLLEPKITANELVSNHQAGVCGEHHVGQFLLRRDHFDFAAERLELVMKSLPLGASQLRQRILSAVHPRIDLVFDAEIIRRAKEQLGHARFPLRALPGPGIALVRAKMARCPSPGPAPERCLDQ